MGGSYRYRNEQRVRSVSLSVPPTVIQVMPRVRLTDKKSESEEPDQDPERAAAMSPWRQPRSRQDVGTVEATFRPHRLMLQFFGRYPFSPAPASSRSKVQINTAGTRKSSAPALYRHSIFTFHWAYFIFTSAFIFFVFVMCTLGFINMFLDGEPSAVAAGRAGPGPPEPLKDKYKIRDNLVAFVLFWSCLFHSTVTNIFLIRSRRRIVNYMNQWNDFMAEAGLEVPSCIKRFLIFANVWYFVFLLFVVGSYAFNYLGHRASVMVATLVLSPFVDVAAVAASPNGFGSLYYLFGLFTLLYGIYASRSVLFVYLFKLRLLRHAFRVWNQRLKEQLQYGDGEKEENGRGHTARENTYEIQEQLDCEKLYSDHVTILTLMKQTDRVYGRILQAYYASQIPNMCFELYFLARFGNISSQSSGSGVLSYATVDGSDILAAVVLLGQTVLLFLTISLDASYVSEEAMKGFELLRARGIRVTDSVPNKYLFYSLEMSYSQRIVLTGGKYFAIDRPFIITVLGAVFTYFIIILQFGIGTFGGGRAPAVNFTQARPR